MRSRIQLFAQPARTSDSYHDLQCSLQNISPSGQDRHLYVKFLPSCRVRDVSCWLGFERSDEKNARVNITMYSTMYSTNDGYTRYNNRKYGNILTGNRNAYEDRNAYEN